MVDMTREEQINWLCMLRADLNNGVISTSWNKEFTEALTGILEPETGHWIIYEVHGHKACKCSKCDKDSGYPCNYKYCPNCGYRMLKPQESEE